MAMPANMRTAVLDGKKILLVNNTVLDKASVQTQIAALDRRINVELPAQRASIKADELLARANASVDSQVAEAQRIKDALTGVVDELE